MTFTFTPAPQIDLIQPSATLAIAALSNQLKAEGKNVISFAVGEPDKATPAHVGRAMADFALLGQNKYASPAPPALADAIIGKFNRDDGLNFDRAQVTAGVGGKELVFWGIGTSVGKDDEVVIPAPYWVSYPEIVNFFGGIAKIIHPKRDDLKITADELRAALTPKTRLFIFNQPSNPAGVVYTKDEVAALANVLREAAKTNPRLVVLSDDIYEKLVYTGGFHSLASAAPDLLPRILLINGLSKSHAFTGARFGYAAGHPAWIAAINKMISQSSTHVPTIVQAGAIAALNGPEDFLVEWKADYIRRRDYVLGELRGIMPCATPGGAFYVFPDIRQYLGGQYKTDKDFVLGLLERESVGCVHGSAFGMAGFMRISYATSDDNLRQGLMRLKNFCGEI
jgi:aspartate aminotransferase